LLKASFFEKRINRLNPHLTRARVAFLSQLQLHGAYWNGWPGENRDQPLRQCTYQRQMTHPFTGDGGPRQSLSSLVLRPTERLGGIGIALA
jgi:hypothetical protein